MRELSAFVTVSRCHGFCKEWRSIREGELTILLVINMVTNLDLLVDLDLTMEFYLSGLAHRKLAQSNFYTKGTELEKDDYGY